MNILIKRIYLGETFTIGELSVDGTHICDTLEDKVRPEGQKEYGRTAIPYGTYEVVLSHSPKFGRVLPEILNVPNFTGIRIHTGNSSKDTEGCILVGDWDSETADWIINSKVNFNKLFKILQTSDKIKLTIE